MAAEALASVAIDDSGPVFSTAVSKHRNTIVVFGAFDVAEPLRQRLDQLNYKAIVKRSAAVDALEAEGERPLAAIVDDTVEGHLELCAGLPKGMPKILITSDRSFAKRRDAARSGVDAIIAKPVDLDELLDWLEQFESREHGAPLSVLLIDDNILLATLYAEALEAAGMIVNIIVDPADAIRALNTAVPDLILMDVRMPGVDGIELARMIRQSRQFQVVPIIFISGDGSEAPQLQARGSGDDFIDKTISLSKLVAVVGLRASRGRALRQMIERDSLTGLLNHARFKENGAAELERCRRVGVPASVVMIDIDRFKTINDTFGHPAGDRVIRTLARALIGRLRSTDIVGRYGGEEFAVLLVGSAPPQAKAVIDEVRSSFKAILFDETARRFSASFSAGIAGNDQAGLPMLIRRADDALYQAKLAGRDRVELAS